MELAIDRRLVSSGYGSMLSGFSGLLSARSSRRSIVTVSNGAPGPFVASALTGGICFVAFHG